MYVCRVVNTPIATFFNNIDNYNKCNIKIIITTVLLFKTRHHPKFDSKRMPRGIQSDDIHYSTMVYK